MKLPSFKKMVLVLVTPAFTVLDLLARLFKTKRPAINVVFYTGKLGDLVCLTPILRTIKQARPAESLYLIARYPFTDILTNNPYIDRVINFRNDAELGNFSWLFKCWRQLQDVTINHYFNLTPSFEASVVGLWLTPSNRHLATFNDRGFNTSQRQLSQRLLLPFFKTAEYRYDRKIKEFYLDLLFNIGLPTASDKNELSFSGNTEEVELFFSQHGLIDKNPIVGVSVASGKEYKQWPADKWLEFLNILTAEYKEARIIFFGSEAEREQIGLVQKGLTSTSLSVIGKTIAKLPYYMKRCNLFVSVDTGLSYIADALGVPVVNIMGPVDPTQQRPENNYKLVTNEAVCRPILKTPPISPLTATDRRDLEVCYRSISAESVLAACKELISR